MNEMIIIALIVKIFDYIIFFSGTLVKKNMMGEFGN